MTAPQHEIYAVNMNNPVPFYAGYGNRSLETRIKKTNNFSFLLDNVITGNVTNPKERGLAHD
jgi:hypothetical protein